MRGTRTVGLVVAALLGVALLLPVSADAATPRPGRPHGERVTSVGTHSVTVAWSRVKHAQRYRVYVSTRRSDLAVARIAKAEHSASTKRPRMTVRGLPATTARYYLRVRAANGSKLRYGARILSVVLRPGTPTRLSAASSRSGTRLSWSAPAGYQRTQIQQAGNRAMTSARRTVGIRGTTRRYTPYGVTVGRTYWFRVRTINGGRASGWSAAARVVVRSRLQPVRLLSYNVLTSKADGTVTTGERVQPWAKRRAGVLALIRRADPDVICLQEAGGWVGTPQVYGGTRQVDDLLRSLPGWTLARTETPPTEHYYRRYGNYVLYRSAAYTAVGTGGVWQVGHGRTAAYQQLRHRGSGARVLVASVHLNFGAGRSGDDQRAAEARSLLAQGSRAARRAGAPVVYTGDFNSVRNRNHAYDAVGQTMAAAGIVDARNVAQVLGNDAYNSANQYRRVPPRVGQSIDYVFAPPGVAVTSRLLLLPLSGGRFRGVIPSDHNPLLVSAAYPY